MDRGSDGRTLGHKRLYCAQCASNADIGKLLAPFLGFAPNPPTDHHSSRKPTVLVSPAIRKNIVAQKL